MSIYFNGQKFKEVQFELESQFEEAIFENYKTIFGENTILINIKKKINSGALGKTIPDALLFDFSDVDNPKFYLVEVELAKHSFYNHIFPQITKFFAFLRNGNGHQSDLVESLHNILSSDLALKSEFSKYLGNKELFKFLKDVIENSSDILIILDKNKKELPEIMQTYVDTWDKYVRVIIIKQYQNGSDVIFQPIPDFEMVSNEIEDVEDIIISQNNLDDKIAYSEEYHLSNVKPNIIEIYKRIRSAFPDITFNPQKYYISLRNPNNFAYITMRKSKVRLIVLMSRNRVDKITNNFTTREPSPGVQKFYNSLGKCTQIFISDMSHIDEIITLLDMCSKKG